MTHIDKTKPVLVTGASGYLGSWIVKTLLDEGINVHAAVRDPEDKEKLSHLNSIAENSGASIKYFKTNLLEEGSYAEAMEGCELVYHSASPFTLNIKDAQKELIDPAVKGTINVLEQANKTSSVKRVVLTSSCAAIYTDAIDCSLAENGILTEANWNTTSSLEYQPYSYSKTLAEKKAWEINKAQDRWDMVTINPSLIMGPALNASSVTSESYTILKQIGSGAFKSGIPRMGIGIVDVRDTAQAHFLAGYTPNANGRYITSAHNSSFFEMTSALLTKYGDKYSIPKKTLPKWMVVLMGPILDKRMSRKYLRNNVNIEWKADNSKIKNELGIKFRPLKETMEESFQLLIDEKIL